MARKKEITQEEFIETLKKFSPGTVIRNALDDLMRAEMGALIVIDTEGLENIIEGGFRINCRFTPQKLVELAKMDGAIILSEDQKRITYSNTTLNPSIKYSSRETGTRHKAAERTSKQFNAVVVAVSERKRKITIYHGGKKHELESTSEVLTRATETLQILEKQKDIFNDQISNLNILEINNLVTISDVCVILQRIEIIKRISEIIKRYLIELGKEGVIVCMRMKELTKSLFQERELIFQDYLIKSKYPKADSTLQSMNFDFLIETSNISRILFEELHDKEISSKGYRILSKTSLLEKDIELIINYFERLDRVFDADKEEFQKIFKNENFVNSLIQDLETLREKIMAGKSISR